MKTYRYRVRDATLLDRRCVTFSAEGRNMAKFELYKSPNGEYRWRLRATNGQSHCDGRRGLLKQGGCSKRHPVGEARGS
jgi:hypothetical protein